MMIRIFCFTMTVLLSRAASAQERLVRVAPMQVEPVPAAFGKSEGELSFRVSDDGQYAYGWTAREARAWRLPGGELVYRYQVGSRGNVRAGVFSGSIGSVSITADGRIIYASGINRKQPVIDAAELESGELVEDGLLLDSLKEGSYQMSRGARSKSELSENYVRQLQDYRFSPLHLKGRADDAPLKEGLALQAVVPDQTAPGYLIAVYSQEFCGDKKWIKAYSGKSVKELRQLQDDANNCQYRDWHAARLHPASGGSSYLGRILPGVEGVDYATVKEAYPSPLGDLYGLAIQDSVYVLRFYGAGGQLLWGSPPDRLCHFISYDAFGNVLLRERRATGGMDLTRREPLTGAVLERYALPAIKGRTYFVDRWGMLAHIGTDAAGNHTVSFYAAETGRLMLALTDAESAQAYAARYSAEVQRVERERQARIAANQKAWEAWQEAQRRSQLEARRIAGEQLKRNSQAAAEHARFWKTCPDCSGTGGYSKTNTYTITTVNHLWGGARTGSVTNEVTKRTYSSGNVWVPCTACNGKGQLRR